MDSPLKPSFSNSNIAGLSTWILLVLFWWSVWLVSAESVCSPITLIVIPSKVIRFETVTRFGLTLTTTIDNKFLFFQLMPYFVMDTLSDFSGVPGLFVTCVFSASLSTLSSGFNALSAVTWDDFLKHTRLGLLDEKHQKTLNKITAIFYGVLSILLAFVVGRIGSVLKVASLVCLNNYRWPYDWLNFEHSGRDLVVWLLDWTTVSPLSVGDSLSIS